MKRLLLFLVIIVSGFNAAEAQYMTGKNGIKYFYWRSHPGKKKATVGDMVYVHIYGKTENDSILFNSFAVNKSYALTVESPTYKGCLNEAFTLMSEEDSAQFQVVADSFFYKTVKQQMPFFVKPGSKLTFVMKMVSIIYKQDVEDMKAREKKYADENQEREIAEYLDANNLDSIRTSSGLIYIPSKKGKGRTPLPGTRVAVHYDGFLLNGTKFDSSYDRGAPFEFVVGYGQVIKGWDEVLQLMHEGDEFKVILPYYLAYGDQMMGKIPAFAALVFEMKLIKIY